MSAFSVIDLIPGVHIDEKQVAGAIAGVSTSNVAILGPAKRGPIGDPKLVTNLTEYNTKFGEMRGGQPWDHISGYFASYAVHGFFRNGGKKCYFVRVSNAAFAELPLVDRANTDTSLIVRALNVGISSTMVEVKDDQIVAVAAGVTALRASDPLAGTGAPKDGTVAKVTDATKFSAGDTVLLDDGGAPSNSERVEILRTNTTANTVEFTTKLINDYLDVTKATIRIADLKATEQEKFRISDVAGIEQGSYVKIVVGAASEDLVVSAVDGTTKLVTFESKLKNTYKMDGAVDPPVTVQTLEFTLVVTPQGGTPETYSKLSLEARHSKFYRSKVESKLVEVLPPVQPNTSKPSANLPKAAAATLLASGKDEILRTLSLSDYKRALDALELEDEVNIVCVPDRFDQAVQQAVIDHCQKMKDRFAILDPEHGLDRDTIIDQRGKLASDKGFGAIYYPRIKIADPDAPPDDPNKTIVIPPSGHIAGVFARVDSEEGVHVAPANKALRGVVGLERKVSETDSGILNEKSVNVLRFARNRGNLIWGARTLATGTQWRYTNVRRLLLYIEESIQEGVEPSVFKPNNIPLWEAIKRQVSEFLTSVWAGGALFGREPAEGFSVRVDEELNPPDQIALGILTVEVQVRPNPPAEFIVFRIIADTSKAIVQE